MENCEKRIEKIHTVDGCSYLIPRPLLPGEKGSKNNYKFSPSPLGEGLG